MVLDCKGHVPLHRIPFNDSASNHDDFDHGEFLKEEGIIDLYSEDFVVLNYAAKDSQHMSPDSKLLILIEDDTEGSEIESNAELIPVETGIFQSCRE